MITDLPFVSIVVPTFNRPGPLAACLGALAELSYPRDRFEVLIVDDGSPVPPHELVARYAGQLDASVIVQANAGPASARNHGAAKARGELLAFTDDDCAPASDWLTALAREYRRAPECALGGRTVNGLPGNVYATASQLLIDYLYGYFNRDPQQARFFASNNFAVPAEAFREMGGFDTSYPLAAGEDRDFCDRWVSAGRCLRYVPEAIVFHRHALGARTYWRQHFNYGRGAYYFHQGRARRGAAPMRPEPPSFYTGLVGYPVGRGHGVRTVPLVVLMGLSQVANAAGFFVERAASRSRQRPVDDGSREAGVR